jgi:Peptidase A4 family
MPKDVPRFRVLSAAALAAAGVAAVSMVMVQPAAVATVNPDVQAPVTTVTSCGNGVSAVSITPAKGFNPQTATTAELDANGFPERPSSADTHEFGQWRSFVTSHSSMRSSCASLRPLPGESVRGWSAAQATPSDEIAAPTTTPNWDGYQVLDNAYSDAEAQWSMPGIVAGVSGTNDYSLSWVGIGSGNSQGTPLLQAGSASYYLDGTDKYFLWYEVVPEQNSGVMVGGASPGNTVGAHITENPTQITGCTAPVCGTIHIWDDTTGLNNEYVVGGDWSNSREQAEWVYERPCAGVTTGNCLRYLADAPVTFTDAQAAIAGGSWQGLDLLPWQEIDMTDCSGNEIADVTTIDDANNSFKANYLHHGDQDVC